MFKPGQVVWYKAPWGRVFSDGIDRAVMELSGVNIDLLGDPKAMTASEVREREAVYKPVGPLGEYPGEIAVTFNKEPKKHYEPENDYLGKMVKGPRKFTI